jgi:D-sedoheptulose 7-phosphate isomerase
MKNNFVNLFLKESIKSIKEINQKQIEKLILKIDKVRSQKGRIFFLGVGGSAGNCSHAVNDFRKLCEIECYTPTDNVCEITARTNDEGWKSTFIEWLKISNLNKKDCIFVFSVGGGNKKKKVSENLIHAIDYARFKKAKIFSFVGKNDGYAYKKSDISVLIPAIDDKLITPFSESFQAVLWHLLVSHPKLKKKPTKW